MKKIFLTLVMAATVSAAFSQFNMHLTYGTLDSKRVTFGYDICKFTPYVAFDAFTLGAKMTDVATLGGDAKINASVIAPTLGVRYYFLSNDKLKGFGNISAQKVFLGAKVEDGAGNEINLTDIFSKKNVWQFQASFGAEYFFNHNLSLVAEYGYRYFRTQFNSEAGDGKISINPGMTFARLGLGFHF